MDREAVTTAAKASLKTSRAELKWFRPRRGATTDGPRFFLLQGAQVPVALPSRNSATPRPAPPAR